MNNLVEFRMHMLAILLIFFYGLAKLNWRTDLKTANQLVVYDELKAFSVE